MAALPKAKRFPKLRDMLSGKREAAAAQSVDAQVAAAMAWHARINAKG